MALTVASVILDFHTSFSRVVVIYSGVIGAWGLFLFLRSANPSPGYLGALVIAEGVAVLQGIVGLVTRTQTSGPHDGLHYLYGVILVLTLPTAYFLSGGGTQRRDSLIFGLAGLFMLGIGIRGITTGA
jgi:heme A synthase